MQLFFHYVSCLQVRETVRMTSAGVALCLVMLLASEDHILRLYNLVLPGMALILTNFAVMQRFLDSSCFAQPLPPPPPPPASLWSQLVSYLSAFVQYFVGEEKAAVVEVDSGSCDYYHEMLMPISQLAVTNVLIKYITAACSKLERSMLTLFINLFIVPSALKLVGASQSDIDLSNTLVCRVVCVGMEIWASLSLERMLYASTHSVLQNNVGLGLTLVELWQRVRRSLLASWLLAYVAQFVDALLTDDVSYIEAMLFNLRHRSWPPMMYLGLCSVLGYLTDIVWQLVYMMATRTTARHNITDNGLSEVLTLIYARFLCWLVGISTADMFSFIIPFLCSLMAARWILRAVKPLLLSDDRPTRTASIVVYLATIAALPVLACLRLTDEKHVYYLQGNLFIALRLSIGAASTLTRSFVRRWYSTDGATDADHVNFVVKVSTAIYIIIIILLQIRDDRTHGNT